MSHRFGSPEFGAARSRSPAPLHGQSTACSPAQPCPGDATAHSSCYRTAPQTDDEVMLRYLTFSISHFGPTNPSALPPPSPPVPASLAASTSIKGTRRAATSGRHCACAWGGAYWPFSLIDREARRGRECCGSAHAPSGRPGARGLC